MIVNSFCPLSIAFISIVISLPQSFHRRCHSPIDFAVTEELRRKPLGRDEPCREEPDGIQTIIKVNPLYMECANLKEINTYLQNVNTHVMKQNIYLHNMVFLHMSLNIQASMHLQSNFACDKYNSSSLGSWKNCEHN